MEVWTENHRQFMYNMAKLATIRSLSDVDDHGELLTQYSDKLVCVWHGDDDIYIRRLTWLDVGKLPNIAEMSSKMVAFGAKYPLLTITHNHTELVDSTCTLFFWSILS